MYPEYIPPIAAALALLVLFCYLCAVSPAFLTACGVIVLGLLGIFVLLIARAEIGLWLMKQCEREQKEKHR